MALKMGASHCKSVPCLVGVDGSSASGYMYFICHMTSHYHDTERSCKFMAWSSLCYVIILIRLVTIRIVMMEIYVLHLSHHLS